MKEKQVRRRRKLALTLKTKGSKKVSLSKMRSLEQAQKEAIEKWLTQNDVETKPMFDRWKRVRDSVSKRMVSRIVNALGYADGLQLAIDSVKNGLGLEQMSFDTTKVHASIDRVLNYQTVKLYLNYSLLPKEEQDLLCKMLMEREFEQKVASKANVKAEDGSNLGINLNTG